MAESDTRSVIQDLCPARPERHQIAHPHASILRCGHEQGPATVRASSESRRNTSGKGAAIGRAQAEAAGQFLFKYATSRCADAFSAPLRPSEIARPGAPSQSCRIDLCRVYRTAQLPRMMTAYCPRDPADEQAICASASIDLAGSSGSARH